MLRRKRWMLLPAILPFALVLGCGGFGKVNQGRVIDYDREKGLVTFIQDSNYLDPGKPKYDSLPPVTVRVPGDPGAMGPAPEAGKLMQLDTRNRKLVIFDTVTQGFRTISYTLTEEHDNVFRSDARIAGRSFPVVDRITKTITAYSAAQRKLITFSLPNEYFGRPDDTWKTGDEIRYYYKDPRQALRFMNITKTDTAAGK